MDDKFNENMMHQSSTNNNEEPPQEEGAQHMEHRAESNDLEKSNTLMGIVNAILSSNKITEIVDKEIGVSIVIRKNLLCITEEAHKFKDRYVANQYGNKLFTADLKYNQEFENKKSQIKKELEILEQREAKCKPIADCKAINDLLKKTEEDFEELENGGLEKTTCKLVKQKNTQLEVEKGPKEDIHVMLKKLTLKVKKVKDDVMKMEEIISKCKENPEEQVVQRKSVDQYKSHSMGSSDINVDDLEFERLLFKEKLKKLQKTWKKVDVQNSGPRSCNKLSQDAITEKTIIIKVFIAKCIRLDECLKEIKKVSDVGLQHEKMIEEMEEKAPKQDKK